MSAMANIEGSTVQVTYLLLCLLNYCKTELKVNSCTVDCCHGRSRWKYLVLARLHIIIVNLPNGQVFFMHCLHTVLVDERLSDVGHGHEIVHMGGWIAAELLTNDSPLLQEVIDHLMASPRHTLHVLIMVVLTGGGLKKFVAIFKSTISQSLLTRKPLGCHVIAVIIASRTKIRPCSSRVWPIHIGDLTSLDAGCHQVAQGSSILLVAPPLFREWGTLRNGTVHPIKIILADGAIVRVEPVVKLDLYEQRVR